MVAYRLEVTGKVQGVFFRKHTKLRAEELGVHGWVRNMPDGSVLIEAEGTESSMKAFVQWCHFGPERAEVEKVDVKEIDNLGYRGFEIR